MERVGNGRTFLERAFSFPVAPMPLIQGFWRLFIFLDLNNDIKVLMSYFRKDLFTVKHINKITSLLQEELHNVIIGFQGEKDAPQININI